MNAGLQPVPPTWPERLLGALAMVGVGLIAVLVTTNVVSRWLGRSIIPDDILLVEELMVAVILLPLGLVTASRAHIAVTVFTDRLGPAAVRWLTLLGHVIGLPFAAALAWAGVRSFNRAWASADYYDGVLHIPMWIGRFVFVFAISVFLLRLAAMILRDARR